MKSLKFFAVFAFLFVLGVGLHAESESKEIVYIKSERFVTPLIQKWIEEYKKVNPNVEVRIADKNTETKDVQMQLITTTALAKPEKNELLNTWGRYALLPVANKESDLLEKKKVNEKTLKAIFFEQNVLDDKDKEGKETQVSVYSGAGKTSFSPVFASFLGVDNSEWKGKKIAGDDAFLINAIQKDQQGVTVNSLNYIYDTATQSLKANIAILPVASKKEHKEVLEKAELKEVIGLLENEKIDLIPVENLAFKYEKNDTEARAFAKWVLSEGVDFNHAFGFLKPEQNKLAEEINRIEKLELTSQN